MGVDLNVLANLNKITNIDLIFPETVLTTTVNENEEVTEVEVYTPQEVGSDVASATADLTTNQVTVDEQTVQVEDLTQPVEETTTTVEETTTEATTEAVKEAQSAPATYKAEPSQGASATYTAPAAPDYASIAASKSENAGLQPQTAAFKEEVANLFGITSFSGVPPRR